MLRLIKYEFIKLFQTKAFLFSVLLLLLINGAFLYHSLSAPPVEDDLSTLYSADWEQQDYKRQDYKQYLAEIDAQADQMLASDLFGSDPFSRQNLLKTKEVYGRLSEVTPVCGYADGLKHVTDFRPTDVFLLSAVICLLLYLLISERNDGLLHLLKPASAGRGGLICAKIITAVVCTMLLAALFYGSNLASAAAFSQMGEFGAPIQSLDGYMGSPFAISAGQYLTLFFLCKIAAAAAVAAVFFFLCLWLKNMFYALCAFGALSLIELLLSLSIEDYSILSPLKQFNFISILDTTSYFSSYTNFHLFNLAVNSVWSGAATAAFVTAAGFILGAVCFVRENSSGRRKGPQIPAFFQHLRQKNLRKVHASLSRAEAFKLLVMKKGALILAALLLFQTYIYADRQYFSTSIDYYYHGYSQSLAGEPGPEKERFLSQTEAEFLEAEQSLEEKQELYEKGEIGQAVLDYYTRKLTPDQGQLEAFDQAQTQYREVLQLYETDKNAAYVDQTGWNVLFGDDGKRDDLLDFIKLFLALILALSGIFSVESSSGMKQLQICSAAGSVRVKKTKRRLCGAYCIAAALAAFLPRFISAAAYYDLTDFSASIKSLFAVQTSLPVPVLCYLALYLLFRLAVSVAAGNLILFFSEKTGRDISALAASAALLLTPPAVMLILSAV